MSSTPQSSHQLDEREQLRERVAQLEQQLDQARSDASMTLRYRSLADGMPQMVWATDSDGEHLYYNRGWYEYTGLSEQDSLGFGFTNALHPDDLERTLERWRRAWQKGESYEIEYRFRRHDGAYRWFIGRAQPVRAASGEIFEWVGTCTDIDEQKRTSEALSFLAEASALLASSLDYETTLTQLVQFAVPRIADWCAIDIQQPDGSVRRLAVAHVDPAKVALAHEIQRQMPFDPDAPSGLPRVLRTGEPDLVPVITEQMIIDGLPPGELREMFLHLAPRSTIVVPLIARGRVLGGLTLVSAESQRYFGDADLRIANELARRAAVPIDNSRLYSELRRFRTTLDQTHDCVFMFDAQTLRFFYVNQGAVDQVGYSHAELLAMTPLALMPEFDAASYQRMLDTLIAGEQTSHTIETVHRHRDGHLVPVEVGLQYVAPEHETGRFVAIVRDLSERREALATLAEQDATLRQQARLIDLAHEAIIVRDSDGCILRWNRGAQDLYGWNDEEVLGNTTHELLQTRFAGSSVLSTTHQDEILVETGAWEGELLHTRRDGQQLVVESRQAAFQDEHAARVLVLEINRDITARKQYERELQERTRQLANASATLRERNRELDQFAYITSHDLKAPLRGIGNLAQWIEEDLGEHASDEVRNHLELLRGRVRRMEALINGILHYSRVGRTGGAVETVEVGELLADVIDLLAPPERVVVELAPELPTIRTERLLLHQVFSNLIGNAIKHSGNTALRIKINSEANGAMYTFAVADNGPGIAPQYHERIFGIFQTLAPRDEVEGSGLGLALVKKIVEHQGGTIWLESREGAGATFFFRWPAISPLREATADGL